MNKNRQLRLDTHFATRFGARVQNAPLQESSARLLVLFVVFGISLFSAMVARAAVPYNSATVTRVENKVSYGQVRGGQSETRPANPQDVVKASNFLLSQTDSRAELKYEDGTIVRIGQNTVFTFDASTRTLQLEKGTFVAHIPKGSGGATIKTPSLTAAITGTVVKVAKDRIAVAEGSIFIKPSGPWVHAGQYYEVDEFGVGHVYSFRGIYDGMLMTWNGQLVPLIDEIVSKPGIEFTVTLDQVASDAFNGADAVINRQKKLIPDSGTTEVTFETY